MVKKDHLNFLKFHSCKKKYYSTWTRLLNRADFKVNENTKVCSNQFKYGQPFPVDPHPTLFMKGYDIASPVTPRRPPPQRSIETTPRARPRTRTLRHRSIGVQVDPSDFESNKSASDHDYVFPAFRKKQFSADWVAHLEDEIEKLTLNCDDIKVKFLEAKAKVTELEAVIAGHKKNLTVSDIANSDSLFKLYTGLPSYAVFQWLLAEVSPHAQNLHYFKGKDSMTDKSYQVKNQSKPGPKRTQSLEDELLMTLMKLRLNLREEDLAFRFGVGQSTVSRVLSTWLPFLAKELVLLFIGRARRRY